MQSLAKQIKNLDIFTHVSTCYVNCNMNGLILEQIYESGIFLIKGRNQPWRLTKITTQLPSQITRRQHKEHPRQVSKHLYFHEGTLLKSYAKEKGWTAYVYRPTRYHQHKLPITFPRMAWQHRCSCCYVSVCRSWYHQGGEGQSKFNWRHNPCWCRSGKHHCSYSLQSSQKWHAYLPRRFKWPKSNYMG